MNLRSSPRAPRLGRALTPESQNSVLQAAMFTVLTGIATACGNSKDPTPEDTDQECVVDAYQTQVTLSTWTEADQIYYDCQTEASDTYQSCLDKNDEREEGEEEDCFADLKLDEDWCRYGWMDELNQEPQRNCGTTVYTIIGEPGEEHFASEGTMDEDPDGDGISSYMEYLTLTDPCQATSYVNPDCPNDGELDKDGDGISNAEDPAPYCYGDLGAGDPAEEGSDCA